MQTAIPCVVMRGGTSKGLYFHRDELPPDASQRRAVLIAAMGSPDDRQIDGMGGGHPLTSKVAIINASTRDDADVDYLFLQVDKAEVSDSQNCGNILAGVGPFAIEEGLVAAEEGYTTVRIHMVNTGAIAIARVQTTDGAVVYAGEAHIDGVPGTAAPVMLEFKDIAGSSCGALLPTGNAVDLVDDIEVTCIDNGMPVVVIRAADLGKTGYESPAELEADKLLTVRIENIRLQIAERMRLGDVTEKTVPKLSLVSLAKNGGTIHTRTFIPHRVHQSIGVLGAVSVATACLLPGSTAYQIAQRPDSRGEISMEIEHPTGFFTVAMVINDRGKQLQVEKAALLRTARILMRGAVYVPADVWGGV